MVFPSHTILLAKRSPKTECQLQLLPRKESIWDPLQLQLRTEATKL